MSKQKQKFYTVWVGRKPGVYSSWDECKKQTAGFDGAQFKSFETQQDAEAALKKNYWSFVQRTPLGVNKSAQATSLNVGATSRKKPEPDSIAVDGAWNTDTLDCEYRGVYVKTGEQLFIRGPYRDGTNNVVEFLGIVHALAYCQKNNLLLPIYSDSLTALSWTAKKKAKTKLEPTKNNTELFDLIQRGEKWLQQNKFANRLLKWETELWGENPADFGRK